MSATKRGRVFDATKLIQGKTYRVITEFTDYDGQVHKVGERWRFLSHNFLPYEDGLTLSIERAGKSSTIRLQWRAEAQASIIDRFSNYVREL